MKNKILKLIEKATNKKKFVFDINGNQLSIQDMKEDTFYCWNKNTLGSKENIASWIKYVDSVELPKPKASKPKSLKKVVK